MIYIVLVQKKHQSSEISAFQNRENISKQPLRSQVQALNRNFPGGTGSFTVSSQALELNTEKSRG